jgi:hypothetical protein
VCVWCQLMLVFHASQLKSLAIYSMKCVKEYPCNLDERHFIRMVIFEPNGCILTPTVEDSKEDVEGKTSTDKGFIQEFKGHNEAE